MTDEELQAELEQRQARPQPPMQTRHVSESIGCSDEHARAMADSKRLIDADGMLHCWNCRQVCDWHVSLHCTPCRVESLRQAPERHWLERERHRLERQREIEQSRPQPRVANRSFRDDY